MLKYDDVRNTQRAVIYEQRDMVLEGENLKEEILDMLEEVVDGYLDMYVGEDLNQDEWNVPELIDWVGKTFLIDISTWRPEPENQSYDEIREKLLNTLHTAYEEREQQVGSETMRKLERYVMLDRIDDHWIDHLYNMDYMEEGIGLQAYGHKDPLVEFKREGHAMFSAMVETVKEEVVEYMFKIRLAEESEEQQPRRRRPQHVRRTAQDEAADSAPIHRDGVKVGRNDPCPCGSGKKYKKCCGR